MLREKTLITKWLIWIKNSVCRKTEEKRKTNQLFIFFHRTRTMTENENEKLWQKSQEK